MTKWKDDFSRSSKSYKSMTSIKLLNIFSYICKMQFVYTGSLVKSPKQLGVIVIDSVYDIFQGFDAFSFPNERLLFMKKFLSLCRKLAFNGICVIFINNKVANFGSSPNFTKKSEETDTKMQRGVPFKPQKRDNIDIPALGEFWESYLHERYDISKYLFATKEMIGQRKFKVLFSDRLPRNDMRVEITMQGVKGLKLEEDF